LLRAGVTLITTRDASPRTEGDIRGQLKHLIDQHMEISMKTPFLAVTLLALSTSFANAEVNSLSGKAMSDLPGTKGGFTAAPLAKNFSGSLEDRVALDRPDFNQGRTADPLFQPDEYSLSGKVMKDWRARS
jgi:hypothetical protein